MVWKFNNTQHTQFKICTTKKRECINCKANLYFTKTRRGTHSKHRVIKEGHIISATKRFQIYKTHQITIGPNQSLCAACNEKDINELIIRETAWKPVEIPEFLSNVLYEQRKAHKQHQLHNEPRIKRQYRHKNESPIQCKDLSDEKVRLACGISKTNLIVIQKHVNEAIEDHSDTGKLDIEDLFIACCVWRQNMSYSFAAVTFGFTNSSGICHLIDRVLYYLSEYWVEDWLGKRYWNKREILKHIPEAVNKLHPNKNVIGCVDATYLYTQKSRSSYQFQKATYSKYKHRNLLKEHVLCTPDGKVVFVDGPYYADGWNQDDKIWDSIVHNPDHQLHTILPDDEVHHVIADRGYRNCHETDHWKLVIPHGVGKEEEEYIDGNGKQKKRTKKVVLNEKQGAENKYVLHISANNIISETRTHCGTNITMIIHRKITKVRNVVERLFARIKQWKILRYEHDIHYDPSKVHLIFRVICSFHNAVGSPLYNSYDDMNRDAERILACENMTNMLAQSEGKTTSGWKGVKPQDLPRLKGTVVPDFSLQDLRKLACGPYALQLAIPYYRHANNIKHMVHHSHPNSVRCVGVISRHSRNDVSKTKYRVYHRFDTGGDIMKTQSYCSCGVGMRTVCLCAHMCASLYVLYHRMNNREIPSQCKLVDKHRGNMLDLYYWKGVWETQPSDMAAVPSLESYDGPPVDDNHNRRHGHSVDDRIGNRSDGDGVGVVVGRNMNIQRIGTPNIISDSSVVGGVVGIDSTISNTNINAISNDRNSNNNNPSSSNIQRISNITNNSNNTNGSRPRRKRGFFGDKSGIQRKRQRL